MQKKTLKNSGRPAFGRTELRSPIFVMLPETFEPLPPEFEALVGRRPDLQRLRFWTVCDLGSADVEATLLAAAFVVRGGHLSKWRKGGRAGTHDRFIKVASKDGGAAGAVLLWESKRGDIVRADEELFTSCFEGTAETSQCFQVVLERRMLFFSAHASSRQRWCEGINCLASGRVRVLAATTRAGRATADSATPDYVVVQDCATGGVYAWNTRNEEANWIRSSGVPSSAGASSCRLSSDEPAAHSVSDPADAGHEAGGRPSPLPRLTEVMSGNATGDASVDAPPAPVPPTTPPAMPPPLPRLAELPGGAIDAPYAPDTAGLPPPPPRSATCSSVSSCSMSFGRRSLGSVGSDAPDRSGRREEQAEAERLKAVAAAEAAAALHTACAWERRLSTPATV